MNSFDSNIDNYSINDLLALMDIQTLTHSEIMYKTDLKINEVSDLSVIHFYSQIRQTLLNELDISRRYDEPNNISSYNFDNEYSYNQEPYSNLGLGLGFERNTSDLQFEISSNTEWESEHEPEQEQEFEQEFEQDSSSTFEPRTPLNITPHAYEGFTSLEESLDNEEKTSVHDTLISNPGFNPKAEQTNIFELPVTRGDINPNLKNTISRFINLDSQFRQFSNNKHSSTNYTLDLSNSLSNVLSLRLYSYEIPFMWYTFDKTMNNTCLKINIMTQVQDAEPTVQESFLVVINSGTYSPTDFVTELNRAFDEVLSDPNPSTPLPPIVSYNSNTGKISLALNGWNVLSAVDNTTIYTLDQTTQVLFFDVNGINCIPGTCGRPMANYVNQTLGWYMGFRDSVIYVSSTSNTGDSIADFIGTKYIMLIVDDYNHNHVNNEIVTISELPNVAKLPDYYSKDMVNECLPPVSTPVPTINVADTIMMGNPVVEYNKTPQVTIESIAASSIYRRSLTTAQIYTINEIHKNRNNTTSLKARAPTTPGILAIIPLKKSSFTVGSVITELSGTLQENERTYFGPVSINRMHIKLIDDKGNILNMNGGDWCVTLIAKCLYQY
ncbi:hypothetical protein OAA60_02125 [Porticoccaceae bacterium]|jgi:hypothetical protein|nr:hypothetical protein [Porticoccaceae bacterium]